MMLRNEVWEVAVDVEEEVEALQGIELNVEEVVAVVLCGRGGDGAFCVALNHVGCALKPYWGWWRGSLWSFWGRRLRQCWLRLADWWRLDAWCRLVLGSSLDA